MASTSLRRMHTKRCGMPCAKLHDRATAPRRYRGTLASGRWGAVLIAKQLTAVWIGSGLFATIAVSGSIPTRACGEAEPCRRRSVPSVLRRWAGTESMLNSISSCSMKSMPPGRLLVFRECLHLGSEADAGCPQGPFLLASLDLLGEA